MSRTTKIRVVLFGALLVLCTGYWSWEIEKILTAADKASAADSQEKKDPPPGPRAGGAGEGPAVDEQKKEDPAPSQIAGDNDDASATDNQKKEDPAPSSSQSPEKVGNWKDAFSPMGKQNELLLNWGVALLAGITALMITTKAHAIRQAEWTYLLLVPAGTFLVGSLRAGAEFQGRLTHQVVNENYSDGSFLNRYLTLQLELFQFALACLIVFALIFLSQIVLGRVRPIEETEEET